MILSSCQQKGLEVLAKHPGNVFLTGRAGTGKSFLIQQYLSESGRETPIVASTGAAAVIVGGRTFHSFFGLGIGEGGPEAVIAKACNTKKVISRIEDAEQVIIDEISMISGKDLVTAEEICRKIRVNDAPWGGIRVIFVGDFCQLPPVDRHTKVKQWAFLSEVWTSSNPIPVVLKTPMRSHDEEYTGVINKIRDGKVDSEVCTYLNSRVDHEYVEHFLELDSTHVLARRDAVENINRLKLDQIDQPLHVLATQYTGDPKFIEQMKGHCPINDELHLKKGAFVMVRVNDPMGRFVNGTTGRVVNSDFSLKVTVQLKGGGLVDLGHETFKMLDANGKVACEAMNYPLSLAYAITIHKVQGATLDEMICDLSSLWDPGQAYVALSRLKTGAGLRLIKWDSPSIKTDPQVVKFHQSIGF